MENLQKNWTKIAKENDPDVNEEKAWHYPDNRAGGEKARSRRFYIRKSRVFQIAWSVAERKRKWSPRDENNNNCEQTLFSTVNIVWIEITF